MGFLPDRPPELPAVHARSGPKEAEKPAPHRDILPWARGPSRAGKAAPDRFRALTLLDATEVQMCPAKRAAAVGDRNRDRIRTWAQLADHPWKRCHACVDQTLGKDSALLG